MIASGHLKKDTETRLVTISINYFIVYIFFFFLDGTRAGSQQHLREVNLVMNYANEPPRSDFKTV